MEKLQFEDIQNQVPIITVEYIYRLASLIKVKKRKGTVDMIAGRFEDVGKKLAKKGVKSIDLIKIAREEIYGA